MRRHEREKLVTAAELGLMDAIIAWQKTSSAAELTVAEHLQVFGKVAHDHTANVLKYEIRYERHGNTDTPGGWAPEGEPMETEDMADEESEGSSTWKP